MTRERLRHEIAPALTTRQVQLFTSVKAATRSVDEQLLILTVEGRRVGASALDMAIVRARLLDGHLRECSG
jgi:hypothetical protein